MMMCSKALSVALLLPLFLLSSAHPAGPTLWTADPRFMNWEGPGPGDVRGPCPGLNTLANHGFINHSGKGLTLPEVVLGLAQGLNVGPDFATIVYAIGLASSAGVTFDLNDLARHNFLIEHDASLSRADAALGDQNGFNHTVYNEFITGFDGMEYTSLAAASKAKINRLNIEKERNPKLAYGARAAVISYIENALYLSTMASDPVTGRAKVSYVRSLFEEERLPYHLGWRPSLIPITLPSLGAMSAALLGLSGEALAEGLTITPGSFKEVFYHLFGDALATSSQRLGVSMPAL